MNAERIIRIIAGSLILLSLALGVEDSPLFHHHNWLWLTAFVGLNLLQSGITKICLMNNILAKFGIKNNPC